MYKALLYKIFKPVIRQLVLELVIPRLHDEAKKTDNKIDDEVVRVVTKIIKEVTF